MADREKVIKGLKAHGKQGICAYYDDDGPACPYFSHDDCSQMLADDVLELLKEQEPVKPKEVNMYPPGQYACGFCGHISVGSKDYHAKYCPECGRGLKWE